MCFLTQATHHEHLNWYIHDYYWQVCNTRVGGVLITMDVEPLNLDYLPFSDYIVAKILSP